MKNLKRRNVPRGMQHFYDENKTRIGGRAVKKQKAFGVFAIILSLTMLYFSSKAVLLEDKDCSMALFILVLGVWSLFTKQDIWE